ncbi:ScbA/BarX family gamma-butyrolactone biosynthesis protein [Streptomyces boncukensis]|uniref:A-factor biosynthesis hotdog domain-containing protein n=1 Tax=Streptomyces boncukensis TaxID=2711219 RepID=A0A6G4WV95_9ACTN|nr:ScbA/BarX family gamma-butyrolactone biosynthesis protein [Streptomyces boncukensis]NGO68923.1 hypothetical protein [Streptomyces boncukensis]
MLGTTLSAHLPDSPTPPCGPGLTATVPRELVHRSAVAEVFLTGSAQPEEGGFTLTGQWPRAHAFFTDDTGPRHDPLIAAETIRQAGLYLAHTAFDVPLGHTFLLRRMDFATVQEQLAIGAQPTDITLDAVTGQVRRRRTSATVELRFTIHRDNRVVATGGGEFNCLAPEVYRRMRGPYAQADIHALTDSHAPLPPALVGRQAHKDVVLAATALPHQWVVCPDPRNAVLFDHAGDHIPGMVLLEAARQAAHTMFAPIDSRPLAVSIHFERYAELDTPCTVKARWMGAVDPSGTVEVTGRQADVTVFTSYLTGVGTPRPPEAKEEQPALAPRPSLTWRVPA